VSFPLLPFKDFRVLSFPYPPPGSPLSPLQGAWPLGVLRFSSFWGGKEVQKKKGPFSYWGTSFVGLKFFRPQVPGPSLAPDVTSTNTFLCLHTFHVPGAFSVPNLSCPRAFKPRQNCLYSSFSAES